MVMEVDLQTIEPPPPGGSIDPFLRGDVDDVLSRFLAARAAELAAIDDHLVAVAGEVVDLIAAGGKRLRPAFLHWGYRAAGGPEHDPSAVALGAALEMLHTFALLHDDVMDRAATRRGRPVAARGFADAHAADGLVGDAAWFGTSAAILAGDIALVWADQLLDLATLTAPVTARRVREAFSTLRLELMAGQYLDLRLEGTVAADPESARRVALLKSGRYTVTRPLELGLALAGPTDRALAIGLRAYGDAIGLAFQLRDDILGVFGDPATTGKSCLDDLRTGKRTLLIAQAMALATPGQRGVLRAALGDRSLDEPDAECCRHIIARTGALASVEAIVRSHHAAAVDAIADVREPARTALIALAASAVDRER